MCPDYIDCGSAPVLDTIIKPIFYNEIIACTSPFGLRFREHKCVCVCVCVCVCSVMWTVAHQALLSMEFSRQG